MRNAIRCRHTIDCLFINKNNKTSTTSTTTWCSDRQLSGLSGSSGSPLLIVLSLLPPLPLFYANVPASFAIHKSGSFIYIAILRRILFKISSHPSDFFCLVWKSFIFNELSRPGNVAFYFQNGNAAFDRMRTGNAGDRHLIV